MKTKWMAAMVLLAGAGTALAEGEFEIDQACVAVGCFPGDAPGFPVTLATSGAYRLTSNLIVDTFDGIEFAATRIDLDLAGFEIFGGGSCTNNGAALTCSGGFVAAGMVQDAQSLLVHIHDGGIRGMGGSPILLNGLASGSTLERLTLTENAGAAVLFGFSSSANVRVSQLNYSRNMFGFNVGNGVRLHVSEGEFSNNRQHGLAIGHGSTLTESTFVGNGGVGMNCGVATNVCALGRNSFFGNNGAAASAQIGSFILRDMGGNVCEDGSCP